VEIGLCSSSGISSDNDSASGSFRDSSRVEKSAIWAGAGVPDSEVHIIVEMRS
jgi:hypothetical protein